MNVNCQKTLKAEGNYAFSGQTVDVPHQISLRYLLLQSVKGETGPTEVNGL